MLERLFLRLVVFGVISAAICYGAALNSNEAEARIFLNQTSEKLFNFYDEIANKAFNDIHNYEENDANKNYSIFFHKLAEDARKFDVKNFKDEELKYAFKILVKEADEWIIGENEYSRLADSLQTLQNLYNIVTIDEYWKYNSELTYSPDIEKIIKTSNDSKELEYYWREWRKLTGEWADENLSITIEALNKAAELSDLSPVEFWSRGFNITDMEKLVNEIQPLYMELHAFIRNLLQKKYGESIIDSDGLIPEHLLEQVLDQAWSKNSKLNIIEEMFPSDSLPPVESVIKEKFNGTQLYEIAENFYEKLGFEKYPSSIWGDRIRLSDEDEADDDCESRVWDGTPNIYLEYCTKLSFSDLLQAYKEMGYIYYAKEMSGLPGYFFNTPNSLSNAIGKAVVLSASTHHNLKAIGIISEFNITKDSEINRLLRMAIRNVLYIPLNFVNAKVMSDLLSGNVEMWEVDLLYWHLMEKYAGVGPPMDHESDTFDLPDYFFTEMNDNQMSSDLTVEILSYQIHKKLCELSEKYPKEPLHLCDINGSKKAGNALKKMVQLGVSKPFYEVLGTMFPENPTVKAEALLEYYKPIQKLLAKKNQEANVEPGWKTSNSV